jgi:hypothetical protein
MCMSRRFLTVLIKACNCSVFRITWIQCIGLYPYCFKTSFILVLSESISQQGLRTICINWLRFTSRLLLKCDGTRAETRFRLAAKWTSTLKSAGVSVQSTTGSRGVRISGSNAGYTLFRGSVKGAGYPLHSPVSPSVPLLCVTVCHHVSTGLYLHYQG